MSTDTTQQRDAVALNVCASAGWGWIVGNLNPDEWHGADVFRYGSLESPLSIPNFGRTRLLGPCWHGQARFASGKCAAHEQSKHRPAMIPAKAASSFVLRQSVPERSARCGCHGMCADTNYPRTSSRARARLAGFKAEIDAPFGPT